MTSVADAYDGAALGWHDGPERVYARLADALVAASPVALNGARVLDVGAGTAVAASAALRGGAASAVASDLAAGMLRHRDRRIAAVVADIARLPFPDAHFDLVTAAFCLGHLPDPVAGMAELRRVGNAVVASAFVPGWTHPAKEAVDAVMAEVGFVVPPWYRQVKDETEPAVNDAAALIDLAHGAGFGSAAVQVFEVDSGLETPADVVAWRLGMAHLAPFVAGLPVDVLDAARARAEAVVAQTGPVVIPILALSAS
jgi:ubiquinone/menaquinone biosynthesis C-methylase UbiE